MKLLPNGRCSFSLLHRALYGVILNNPPSVLVMHFFNASKQLDQLLHRQVLRFDVLTLDLIEQSHLRMKFFSLNLECA